MFNNIDWDALKWALVSCLPFILAVVFLIIHIADIMEDRKVKKSLRAKVKALKKGDKAYWDAPKTSHIHYLPKFEGEETPLIGYLTKGIESPYKMPTTAEATAFFKEAAKVGISVKDAKEGLEKAKAYIHKEDVFFNLQGFPVKSEACNKND